MSKKIHVLHFIFVLQYFPLYLCIAFEKANLTKISASPLYPCQLSENVCSGGGVRHIGYTCERMENEKFSTLRWNWNFDIYTIVKRKDLIKGAIMVTRKNSIVKSNPTSENLFQKLFIFSSEILSEMHKTAITLKGNFLLLFHISADNSKLFSWKC